MVIQQYFFFTAINNKLNLAVVELEEDQEEADENGAGQSLISDNSWLKPTKKRKSHQ